MAHINLNISLIQGYTATERAQAISAELFAITRPPNLRNADDVSLYLFGWITRPTTGEAVLQADSDYVINVHPQNNLNNLIALMPDLPQAVKDYLVDLIQNNQTITFGQLLIGNETILTNEQMATDGWFETEN
jgi:predicted nucleotidyltransferase